MPTPIATLNWSGRGKTEGVNGNKIDRTLYRTYTVRDAETADQALLAAGLPGINQEFEPGSIYRVRHRAATDKQGPTTWEIRVDYAIPENGTFPTDEIDPLQRPTVLTTSFASVQKPSELDAAGYYICNSAGDFFDPLPVEDREIEVLTATKWFAFYDRAIKRRFANTYNKSTYTIGNQTYLPGEIRCARIYPLTSYEAGGTSVNASRVQMAFEFELDNDARPLPQGATAPTTPTSGYPFDHHLADVGRLGWWQEGTKKIRGRFCTRRLIDKNNPSLGYTPGRVLDEPVLLNGKGKPIDPEIKIAIEDPNGMVILADPVESPDTRNHMAVADHISPFDSPTTRVWRWHKSRPENFDDLPI